MARNLFSVPIFFIVFRDTLEASVILAVLLGLVEQIVLQSAPPSRGGLVDEKSAHREPSSAVDVTAAENGSNETPPAETTVPVSSKQLLRKLRLQVFLGAGLGLFIALAIGAAFLAVWFTQANNIWGQSEEVWEGVFCLIAALLIFPMALGMLKMDQSRATWRARIAKAFDKSSTERGGRASRWVLFMLPFITVLREGLEAVVFVGGVSLGQPAESIPIATIVGIICGLIVGYVIYTFASHTALRVFMIVITNLLLLVGAGLFSRAASYFEVHRFNLLLGGSIDDLQNAGDGPGSYDVRGNVWHLNCCNPEYKWSTSGWNIFGALFGWTNNATVASVTCYIAYWVAIIAALVFMRVKEKKEAARTRG
ncbi:iron permease FTR1 [Auriculariales sp. MPI-PUGE-AT-0066]|nr:iron permease FTR1 [Auriculariales sp. MPI-PUGE-AT-0066]